MLRSDLAPSTAAPRRRRCSAARGLSPAGQLPGREPRTNGQTAASQRSSGATVRAYVPARHLRPGSGILRLHRARGKVPVGQTLPGGDGRVAADWRGSLSVIRSQGRVEPCRLCSVGLPAIQWCRWRPEQQFCRADEPIRAAEHMPGLWASGFSPGPVSPACRAISQTVSAGKGRFAPASGRLRAEGDALQFIDDEVGVAFGSQTACHPRSSNSGIFDHSGDGASETSLHGEGLVRRGDMVVRLSGRGSWSCRGRRSGVAGR